VAQLWDRISRRRRRQCHRDNVLHLVSISGLTLETPETLISGPAAFVPKLTIYGTATRRSRLGFRGGPQYITS
jgi:hypothetical protein